MKLPESIRVGSLVYRVLFDDVPDGNGNYGETSAVNLIIHIGKLSSDQRLPNTLLHEILHAVDMDRGTKLKEAQVSNLANGLCAVLQGLGYWPWEFER